MAKRIHTIIAEHLGWDSLDVWENCYQYGRFNKRVYTIGNCYMTSGKSKPVDSDGLLTDWKPIVSAYDGKSIIWICEV